MNEGRLSKKETIGLVYTTDNYQPVGGSVKGNIDGLEITTYKWDISKGGPIKGGIRIIYNGIDIGDKDLVDFYSKNEAVVKAIKYSIECAEKNRKDLRDKTIEEGLKKAREILKGG